MCIIGKEEEEEAIWLRHLFHINFDDWEIIRIKFPTQILRLALTLSMNRYFYLKFLVENLCDYN